MVAAILFPILIAVAVVLIYRHRFSIFKRCGVCGKWPWQTFEDIHETSRGMVCSKCRSLN
jgi:hypothetical protein